MGVFIPAFISWRKLVEERETRLSSQKKNLFIRIFQNRESMCDILVGPERPCLFYRDCGSQLTPLLSGDSFQGLIADLLKLDDPARGAAVERRNDRNDHVT